jgi:prepilin-type N-terminal cleavage/methylation domain-containing protein
MARSRFLSSGARGFTIIELLIAMSVFSVVLMMVTVAIMQISKVYYKGVTETNTQSTARGIMDTITQAIQFNGGTVTATPGAPGNPAPGGSYDFCVNNQEFSYRPGYQLIDNSPGTHQTNHSLVVRTVSGCSSPTGQNLSAGGVTGRELMAPNMRLSSMVVQNLGNNLYKVQVRVVYGDDTLLISPSGNSNAAAAPDAACRGGAGQQFCSVSDLSAIVISRVK